MLHAAYQMSNDVHYHMHLPHFPQSVNIPHSSFYQQTPISCPYHPTSHITITPYNNSISSNSTHPPKPTSSRIPLGLSSKPLQIPTLGQRLDQLHTKRKIIMPPPLILILPLLPQLLLFHQLQIQNTHCLIILF